LYIAKILSTSEYGIFIYISMLLSLLPLLQFGSMHGTIILLPKSIVKKDDSEENLFWTYNTMSHLIQIISVVVLLFFDIELNKSMLLVVAINFIFSKYTDNIQIYLSSHLEFQKANIIKSLDQVLRPIMVLVLFAIYKNIESIFVAQLICSIFAFFVSNYFVKFKIILPEFQVSKNIIKQIYSIGFFVYLIWAIDILFRTADRWFISQFYSLDELATYGFTSSLAMNIWLLSMSFFAPYSQMLYKYVAESNFVEVKQIVENTNKKLYILLAVISIISIVFYPFVLEYFVHKYFGTEFLFATLVATSVFLSINNMYIYYMISNHFHFILLRYQGVVLGLNIVLNGIFAYLHLDIVYYSYSTILSLGLYFILVRRYFYIDIEKKLGVCNI
jgi:O-antigen/teichoic acid export membrane protein